MGDITLTFITIIIHEFQSDASPEELQGCCRVTVFSLWLWPVPRTAERPDKQLSLQSAPKTVDSRQRRGRRWQWVPDLRGGDRKCSVTDRFVQRTRDLQRWRRAGAQPPVHVHVENWMELTGQVLWRRTVQTAIRKNGKTDVKEPITIRCDGDNISLTMCVTFSVLSDHRLMTPQGVLDQTQPTSHDY